MTRLDDLQTLPDNLPVPVDDGAADHLAGAAVPAVALPSTAGETVRLDRRVARWVVVYCYSRTGRPNEDDPGGTAGWNAIPGARGCTPQSCSYRDHYKELQSLGAEVFGLSTQPTEYQREMRERLHLPFEILSDANLAFTHALRLPTFEVAGLIILKRLTLIVSGTRIERCFYPVFPPDADAGRVVEWLSGR